MIWCLDRRCCAVPVCSEKDYRTQMVHDRRKSLTMMGLMPPRLMAGALVNNEDPLPRAITSRLAANLQLWAEYNSWQICRKCHSILPRELSPAGLDGLLSPYCGPGKCPFCRGVRAAPAAKRPPSCLVGLSAEVRAALSPIIADFGMELRSADEFGRGNGYRQHAKLVTFAWKPVSLTNNIAALAETSRGSAEAAFKWLLDNSGPAATDSAYGEFLEERECFLATHTCPEPRELKRWLRFLEREGLECALWPDLFWQRRQCLTWARLQSQKRQVQQREADGLEAQQLWDMDVPIEQATGLRRSYMALVLNPLLDYSLSYDLLHFAFDLSLWTDLGSKRNLNTGVPMRLMMKGHSFSSEY